MTLTLHRFRRLNDLPEDYDYARFQSHPRHRPFGN